MAEGKPTLDKRDRPARGTTPGGSPGRRRRLRALLRSGYEEMAGINLALAEEAFPVEHEIETLPPPRLTGAG